MANSKSSNNPVVPEAREALNKFKMEAATEVDVFSHQKIRYRSLTYQEIEQSIELAPR